MKNTHHIFLLTLSITVTILVASIFSYMKFAITSMTQDTVNARAESGSLIAMQNEAAKIKNLNDNVENSWNQLYQEFIQPDASISFIESLESLGSASGSTIAISSIDNMASAEGDLAVNGYMSARVSAQGSWSSVFKTLMLAENMAYKVFIDGVRFDAIGPADGKSSTMWSLGFNLSGVKSI
ncbi:MAG: hypothetical protein WCP09_00335 [Candidatus Taylorbacteria bacterium]